MVFYPDHNDFSCTSSGVTSQTSIDVKINGLLFRIQQLEKIIKEKDLRIARLEKDRSSLIKQYMEKN